MSDPTALADADADAAAAAETTVAPLPPAPAPGPPALATAADVAALAGQLATLADAVRAMGRGQAPPPAKEAAPVVRLNASEVPAVGSPVIYKGRHGVVLEVLSSARSDARDGKGAWTQYSVRVGLFRETHVVDAEALGTL